MAPTPEEMQKRLDDLGEGIEAAREQAEEDGLLPEDDPEDKKSTFADPDPADDHGDPGDEELPSDATG